MIDPEDMLDRLHADLGWKRLRAGWAKAEIFLGLLVAGIGIWALARPTLLRESIYQAVGLVLFVLGGYLAMAGHRSHLYQSNNALAAWLASVLTQRRSDPSKQIKELR
jgi:sulfite exporter TauE/SafE